MTLHSAVGWLFQIRPKNAQLDLGSPSPLGDGWMNFIKTRYSGTLCYWYSRIKESNTNEDLIYTINNIVSTSLKGCIHAYGAHAFSFCHLHDGIGSVINRTAWYFANARLSNWSRFILTADSKGIRIIVRSAIILIGSLIKICRNLMHYCLQLLCTSVGTFCSSRAWSSR